MNKVISAIMTILLLAVITGCSSEADANSNAKVDTAAAEENTGHRIVATTVAATEIMDALELDLVGIPTSYKQLPKRYEGITKVGNPMSPNMEILKSLDPTEVLSVTTLEYDLAPVFENAAVPANFLDLTSIGRMNDAIRSLGDKYGREKQAEAIIHRFNDKMEQIRKETEGKKRPSVLILLGVPGSYLVATEHSYIGDLVKLAGGINIVQGETVEYLASNTEYLQQANPDVILRAAHGMPDEVVKMFDQEFKKNDIWKHFDAVKNNRVYDLKEELFGTTGNLAAVEALNELVKMLYP
ncbi:heme ABC transporter substrate-binding protein IsdE [Paenibacillus naphthalenovorans]|uniref:High-affinity heme uptake system protein IsdE n=1 Tax=Paenibacillus naphthalenovorans TaxID=162209 RepID=A0A0U2VXZ5_9BACL|nr:heme ABC transporter substrate-binding protein IsdE [Paenibacillus naphthalenovorans]ALS21172.1 heme ABC transporter substrate-binding protein [Paenibacillus naphthalenovorans]GCL72429.1 heme ABC transporter substrate-binding protein IsdE [Paenibacillus naphthalenovorans]SDI01070.1 iron complex transport system substrate-binding protein [Paenibacillus naphthalenovorans]